VDGLAHRILHHAERGRGQPCGAAGPVVTTLTSGNPQPLTLSIASLSAGLHASLDSTSLRVGDVAHLTLSADAEDLGVDGQVVVLAQGTTSHSAALLVQVNDWSLTLSPSHGFVGPGTSQLYTLTGQVTAGQAELVTLAPTVSGLPAGVTASFSTLTLTPAASTTLLTLSASPSAQPSAPTTFVVTAGSASRLAGHSARAQLQVDALPGVVISSPAAGATVSGVTTVQVTATPAPNSAAASIAVAVDGNPLAKGTAASVDWDTRGLPNGSHSLQATVVDADGVSNSASQDVTVANAFDSFTLAVTPGSVTMPPGGTASLRLSTAALGVPEPITITLTGLPPGVDSAAIAPLTAGDTAALSFLATADAATSAATTITILGTSPSQPKGYSVTASVSVGVPRVADARASARCYCLPPRSIANVVTARRHEASAP
jgi:hypothetical protein